MNEYSGDSICWPCNPLLTYAAGGGAVDVERVINANTNDKARGSERFWILSAITTEMRRRK